MPPRRVGVGVQIFAKRKNVKCFNGLLTLLTGLRHFFHGICPKIENFCPKVESSAHGTPPQDRRQACYWTKRTVF